MRVFFRIIKFLIPLLVTLLILSFLFSKINYKETERVFAQSNKPLLLLAVLIFFLPSLISALRWKTLMNLAGLEINYREVLGIFLANTPISKISPLNSGDLARSLYLKEKIPIGKNLNIVLTENLLDFMLVSFLAFWGGLFLKIKIAMIFGLIVFLLALLFFLFVSRVKINFSVIFYTLLSWLVVLICFKTIFYSLGFKIPFFYIITAQPIAILLGLIPITVSGVGVRESTMIYLYGNFAPPSSVMAVGLTYSLLAAILLPLLCLPFLFKHLWK